MTDEDKRTWAIIATIVVFITLMILLGGAAQACKIAEFTGDSLRIVHPDSTMISVPRRPKGTPTQPLYYEAVIVHRRIIHPDDWCAGRVDTLFTLYDCMDNHVDTTYDTTWVLCCDSAADWNLSDSVPTEHSTIYIDTASWNVPDWIQHPECWYIESVDTTWFSYIQDSCGIWLLRSTCDTTWAKKIPLAEKYVTPEEWERIMRIARNIDWGNK